MAHVGTTMIETKENHPTCRQGQTLQDMSELGTTMSIETYIETVHDIMMKSDVIAILAEKGNTKTWSALVQTR